MAKTAAVDISQQGDATVFTVTPGGVRRNTSILMGGLTFVGASVLFREALGEMLFWIILVFGGLIAWFGWGDMRPASHRRKSVIRVSEAGFEVNGKSFARSSVKRLLVRNPLQSNTPARTVVFSGPDAASVNAQIAAHEGYEREWANLVEGTYEIVLDANHQDTVIAGNLSAQSVDRSLRSLCDASGMAYRQG
ncbi:MAG: hypothetical protein U5J99_03255 [Parvularculaceae bacterium]|nr:hypothetical protein [Parvularculaceae bacterium]